MLKTELSQIQIIHRDKIELLLRGGISLNSLIRLRCAYQLYCDEMA